MVGMLLAHRMARRVDNHGRKKWALGPRHENMEALPLNPQPIQQKPPRDFPVASSDRAGTDLIILVVLGVVVFLLSSRYEVFEAFHTWSRMHDSWRADDIAAILVILSGAIGIFATRRWKELTRETKRSSMAERAQATEQTMLRTLIDNIPDRIYIKDAQSRFLLNNIAHMQALGAESLEELIGKTDFDYRPVEMATRSYTDDQEVIRSGQPLINREEKTILQNGSQGWTLSTKVPMRNHDGRIIGIVGISRNITERKRTEEALKSSEAKFRSLFENVQEGVYQSTPEGKLITVNPAFVRLFGYDSESEILAIDIARTMYADPVDRDRFAHMLLEQGEVRDYETRLLKKNRDEIIVLERARAVRGEDGAIIYYEGTVGDITERKQREDAIRKLSIAVEQSPVSIVITDTQGTIEYVNPKFMQLTGYLFEEAVGMNPRILKSGKTSPEVYQCLWDTITSGKEWHGEILNRKKNGELYWEQASICPITDTNGKTTHFLAVKEDITERKRAENLLRRQANELEEANTSLLESKARAEEQAELLKVQAQELNTARETAEEASRLKSEFVANMSHEIRTPMNGIIGMTSLLLDTELTSEQREFTDIVRRSGDALLTVINDVLDFSKIEAGKLSIETIDFDLISVVEGVVELLTPRAQEKGLEIGCLLDRDVLRTMRGDPGRVRQVLTNLVGNAIKFTEKGEVTVGALIEEETEHGITVRFTVSDTGIGISDDVKKRLFQSFSQADGSMTRKYGGTGLGLAICKQLVEIMGGTIGVDSEPGKGSTFWWIGNFKKHRLPAGSQVSRLGLAGLRCLIVDDSKVNRTIVHHYITSWGMGNGSAKDGPRALDLLRTALRNGHPYDLAILDMQMPDMDGVQLAQIIKADADLAKTRLILLTSMGNQNAALLKKVGFSAGLAKPIRQSQLFDCIANVMADTLVVSERGIEEVGNTNKATYGKSPGMTMNGDPRKDLRILVAEDNPVNQKVAVRMLEKMGYKADVAGNGGEAVVAVSNIPYDMVFMDCQMPEVDGYEATARIRAMEGTKKHTTIIAMTAHALQGDREKCLDAGMDDYIAKPVRQDDLAAAIDRWSLARETNNGHCEKPTNDTLLLDESVLEGVSDLADDDNPDLLEQLLGMFVHETPRRTELIRQAMGMGDPYRVCEIAHMIKGTCSQLGLVAMVSLCQQLEDRAQSHGLGDCNAIIVNLEQTYRDTAEVLKSRFMTREV